VRRCAVTSLLEIRLQQLDALRAVWFDVALVSNAPMAAAVVDECVTEGLPGHRICVGHVVIWESGPDNPIRSRKAVALHVEAWLHEQQAAEYEQYAANRRGRDDAGAARYDELAADYARFAANARARLQQLQEAQS